VIDRRRIAGVAVVVVLLVAGGGPRSGGRVRADTLDSLPDAVLLAVRDVAWDPGRPNTTVGWCGEASIQMALRYHGIEQTQDAIHRAGNPDHDDLYAYEIDPALDALGVCFVAWPEGETTVDRFVDWIRAHLAGGVPALCGVKLHPDGNPDWTLDHFVLVVGYDRTGLVMNTQLDMDGQILVSYEELVSIESAYAFANRWNIFFGRAILGPCRE